MAVSLASRQLCGRGSVMGQNISRAIIYLSTPPTGRPGSAPAADGVVWSTRLIEVLGGPETTFEFYSVVAITSTTPPCALHNLSLIIL